MKHLLHLLLTIALGATAAQAQTVVNVSTATALASAVQAANDAGGARTILLADGTYTLSDTLYVNSPQITIGSQSGQRDRVVIQGDAMSSSGRVGNLIRVAAAGFRLEGVTLQRSRWHLIQIAGEENADSPVIRNCILRDAYEQMIKVTKDDARPTVSSDGGLVEGCLFEYTAGIGPQYYIGGIDAHNAKNWVVRGNTFRSIASPAGGVAEFAVHFWNGSAANLVEGNLIINCDRGIGFGLDGRANSGGIIRNNMIYHAANAGGFADVGIALIESPGTEVYNNSIYFEHSYPHAIEYRFPATTGVAITNNVTNKAIQQLDGAAASLSGNVTTARADWFVAAASGDLHIATAGRASLVDRGVAVAGLARDFDGQTRPSGSGIDIGADEVTTQGAAPMPPQGLQVR
jgi:Right handed beta helix region